MALMSIEEAMRLLELSKGFSNDDLKRAYRKKAKYYHPDRGNDPTGKKMQDINEAYEILNKLKGLRKGVVVEGVKSGINDEPIDIKVILYKFQLLMNLRNHFNNLNKLTDHELFNSINSASIAMQHLIIKYEPIIDNCFNKRRLLEIANELSNDVMDILKNIEEDFKKMYPYFSQHSFKIEYDLTIYSFVKSLDQIKKNTIDELSKDIMKKCEEKFSLYVGYDVVREKFDELVRNCVINILKYPSKRDSLVLELLEEIEIVFENTFDLQRREQELQELIDYVQGIDSVILIQRVDKLKENIENDDFYDELDYLMSEAKSIKEKKYVNNIRVYLIERASIVLKNTEDINVTKVVLDLLKESVELLAKEQDGFLTYDILSYLYGIKFEDLETDRKVLDFVSNKSELPNVGYVYVTKNIGVISQFAHLHIKDEEYELKYKGVYGNSTVKAKTYGEVADDFISLSKFLSNAEFVGKRGITSSYSSVSLLYRYGDMYIALGANDSIRILSDRNIWREPSDKNVDSLLPYKDKKLVLEKITERIKKENDDKKRRKSYPY